MTFVVGATMPPLLVPFAAVYGGGALHILEVRFP